MEPFDSILRRHPPVQRTPWLRDIAVKAGLIVPNLEGIAKNDYDPAAIDSSAN